MRAYPWVSLCFSILPGYNKIGYFFSRSAKKFFNIKKIKKTILPGNAVFLYDIFYVFVFAAQCFNPAFYSGVLAKRDMQ
jgi:hypothetical protein